MPLTLPVLPVLRVAIAAVAVGGMALTAGHAAARNHDLQPIRLSPAPLTPHDRAPGPSARFPD